MMNKEEIRSHINDKFSRLSCSYSHDSGNQYLFFELPHFEVITLSNDYLLIIGRSMLSSQLKPENIEIADFCFPKNESLPNSAIRRLILDEYQKLEYQMMYFS